MAVWWEENSFLGSGGVLSPSQKVVPLEHSLLPVFQNCGWGYLGAAG